MMHIIKQDQSPHEYFKLSRASVSLYIKAKQWTVSTTVKYQHHLIGNSAYGPVNLIMASVTWERNLSWPWKKTNICTFKLFKIEYK